MSRIVIWDLFGGGENSVRQALYDAPGEISNQVIVYTIDIVEISHSLENIVLDLSKENVIKKLVALIDDWNLEAPNIILASPPCESFTKANLSTSTQKDATGSFISGNPYRYKDPETGFLKVWEPGTKWNGFAGQSYPKGYDSVPLKTYHLGNQCIKNALEIIKYFQPTYWYIENPANSYIWDYIKYNLGFSEGILNKTNYSNYSRFFSKKPTGFLSNINLNLEKLNNKPAMYQVNVNEWVWNHLGACRHNERDEARRLELESHLRQYHHNPNITLHICYCGRNNLARSKIPSALINHILQQFIKVKS